MVFNANWDQTCHVVWHNTHDVVTQLKGGKGVKGPLGHLESFLTLHDESGELNWACRFGFVNWMTLKVNFSEIMCPWNAVDC